MDEIFCPYCGKAMEINQDAFEKFYVDHICEETGVEIITRSHRNPESVKNDLRLLNKKYEFS